MVLPRPKNRMRKKDPDGPVWAPRKPDRDNIDKNVLDGLGAYLEDDKQVVLGSLAKVWHGKQGRPGVFVRLRSASTFEPLQEAAAMGFNLGRLEK